ncbi:MAG: hypothetical protein R2724_02320 [Bryobacterales bacterium]
MHQINPVSGTPGVVTFQGLDGLSKYTHNVYLGGVGPRFGFAYRAEGGWSYAAATVINYYGAY